MRLAPATLPAIIATCHDPAQTRALAILDSRRVPPCYRCIANHAPLSLFPSHVPGTDAPVACHLLHECDCPFNTTEVKP